MTIYLLCDYYNAHKIRVIFKPKAQSQAKIDVGLHSANPFRHSSNSHGVGKNGQLIDTVHFQKVNADQDLPNPIRRPLFPRGRANILDGLASLYVVGLLVPAVATDVAQLTPQTVIPELSRSSKAFQAAINSAWTHNRLTDRPTD